MALIGQLEVPVETLLEKVTEFAGFVCLNLAPAMDVPAALIERADLLVVNETEAEFYGPSLFAVKALVARTLGERGAELYRDGACIARVGVPAVKPLDTTGAGDTFTAALTLALIEGQIAEDALRFACAAGAAATTKAGAQPSLPTRAEVEALLA